MINVGILGHVALGKEIYDGQTVKTRELISELKKQSRIQVNIYDTYYLNIDKYQLLYKLIDMFYKNKIIIITLSWNGYSKIMPFIYILNSIFKRKIYDFVIGGSRHKYIANNRLIKKCQKAFEKIYVESPVMVKEYNNMGIFSAEYMPNFKSNKVDMVHPKFRSNILRLCTFSRICKEKGIEDAIRAVQIVNSESNDIKCELTIYGAPDEKYESEFNRYRNNFPRYIKYGGLVGYWETCEVLKNFDLLLFPTYHEGEGFPGTIIDAFSAGLPIIATKWNFNTELIDDNVGSIVPIKSPASIAAEIKYYMVDNTLLDYKRDNCLKKAVKYNTSYVLKGFIDAILSNEIRS